MSGNLLGKICMNVLPRDKIDSLKRRFQGLPDEYFHWLLTGGWGSHKSGYELYPEPKDSAEVFGELSQRTTGYFLMIGSRGWDDWLGYQYDGEVYRLITHDAYSFDDNPINTGLSEYLNSA